MTPLTNCYNNTKMKWINIKHNCILPHFIQFKKSFFYRPSLVAASGHLHYFLSLLFLTFSVSPFRCSHWKSSIKKLFLKFLIFTGKHLYWSLFLIKFMLKTCNLIKKRPQHSCFPVYIPIAIEQYIFPSVWCLLYWYF